MKEMKTKREVSKERRHERNKEIIDNKEGRK
jgi:hypothetical protein